MEEVDLENVEDQELVILWSAFFECFISSKEGDKDEKLERFLPVFLKRLQERGGTATEKGKGQIPNEAGGRWRNSAFQCLGDLGSVTQLLALEFLTDVQRRCVVSTPSSGCGSRENSPTPPASFHSSAPSSARSSAPSSAPSRPSSAAPSLPSSDAPDSPSHQLHETLHDASRSISEAITNSVLVPLDTPTTVSSASPVVTIQPDDILPCFKHSNEITSVPPPNPSNPLIIKCSSEPLDLAVVSASPSDSFSASAPVHVLQLPSASIITDGAATIEALKTYDDSTFVTQEDDLNTRYCFAPDGSRDVTNHATNNTARSIPSIDNPALARYLLRGRGAVLLLVLRHLVNLGNGIQVEVANFLLSLIPRVFNWIGLAADFESGGVDGDDDEDEDEDVDRKSRKVAELAAIGKELSSLESCFHDAAGRTGRPEDRDTETQDLFDQIIRQETEQKHVRPPTTRNHNSSSENRTRRVSARNSSKIDFNAEGESSDEHDDASDARRSANGVAKSSSKHRYWSKFYNTSKEILHEVSNTMVRETADEGEIDSNDRVEMNDLPKIKPAITLTPEEVIQTTLSIVVNVAVAELDPLKRTPLSSPSTQIATFSFPQALPSASLLSADRRKKSSKMKRDDSFAVGVLETLLDLLEQSLIASGIREDSSGSASHNPTIGAKEKVEMSRRVLRSLFQAVFVAIRQLGPSSNADVSLVVMSVLKMFPQPIPSGHNVIASEMIRGVLWSIHKSFDCLPMNPTFIAATVALINDFNAFQGPFFFVQVMEGLSFQTTNLRQSSADAVEVEQAAKATTKAMSALILSCNKTKLGYIHAVKCLKRRHTEQCTSVELLHHHHGIVTIQTKAAAFPRKDSSTFSTEDSDQRLSSQHSLCVVSLLAENLLNSFSNSNCPGIRLQILSAIDVAGICCCTDPTFLITSLLSDLHRFTSPEVIDYALGLTERMLIDQLGAGMTDGRRLQPPCDNCKDRKYSWSCFTIYRDLLLSSGSNEMTDKLYGHILSVTKRCNDEVRKEIFLKLIHPMLKEIAPQKLVAPSCMQITRKNSLVMSDSVFLGCLNSLPLLLQSEISRKSFLQAGGLDQVKRLIGYPNYRDSALRLLESLIQADGFGSVRILVSLENHLIQAETSRALEFFQSLLMKTKILSYEELSIESLYYDIDAILASEESYVTDAKALSGIWMLAMKLYISEAHFRREVETNSILVSHINESLFRILTIICESRMDIEGDRHLELFHLFEVLLFLTCKNANKKSVLQRVENFLLDTYLPQLESNFFRLISHTVNVSLGFDAILNSIKTKTPPKIYRSCLPENITTELIRDKNTDDDDEEAPSSNPPGEDYDGYEGDNECYNATFQDEDSSRSLRPSNEDRFSEAIDIPQLISLVLKVTIDILKAHLDGLDEGAMTRLIDSLESISSIILHAKGNQEILINAGTATLLLDGMRSILSSGIRLSLSAETFHRFHQTVLVLISRMMMSRVSREDLLLLLKLFSCHTHLSLDTLLGCFINVVDAHPHAPYAYLTFPVASSDDNSELETATEALASPTGSEASSLSSLAANFAPIRIGLKETVMTWPLTNRSSFSTFMWMCIPKKNDDETKTQNSCQRGSVSSSVSNSDGEDHIRQSLHILSLGTSQYQMEVWIHPRTCSIIIRLTCYGNMLAESAVSILKPGIWQSVGINYVHEIERERVVVKISVFVDGLVQRDLPLSFQLQEVRKFETLSSKGTAKKGLFRFFQRGSRGGLLEIESLPPEMNEYESSQLQTTPRVLIGDIFRDGVGSEINSNELQFSNLFVMKEAVLDKKIAFALHNLGPSANNFHRGRHNTFNGGSENPLMFVKSEVISDLQTGDDLDILLGESKVDIRQCQSSLILSYSSQSPSHCNTFTLNKKDENSLSLYPKRKEVCTDSSINQFITKKTQIERRVLEIGGISNFLFLFAKVVDVTIHKESQAKALELLLKLANNSKVLNDEFREIGGYKLICKVLADSKCKLSKLMVQCLATVCAGDDVKMGNSHSCYIREPLIISEVFLNWRVWVNHPEAWAECLSMIDCLMSPLNHHLSFNARQLSNIGIVKVLLSVVLEIFQESEEEVLTMPVCKNIVSIVQKMTGTTPQAEMMNLIKDFLLLRHPPPFTYVSHSSASFHFTTKFSDPLRIGNREKKLTVGKDVRSNTDPLSAMCRQNDNDQRPRSKSLSNVLDGVNCEVPSKSSLLEPLNIAVDEAPPVEVSDDSSANSSPEWELLTFAMKSIPVWITKQGVRDKSTKFHAGVEVLISALVDILNGIIVNLPDVALGETTQDVVNLETLLVLAHHPSFHVRAALVRLVSSMIYRFPQNVDRMMKEHDLTLFAAQMHQHEANRTLIEACLTMVLGRPMSITEDFWVEEESYSDPSNLPKPITIRQQSVVVVLGALEQTAHDLQLLHNTLVYLIQMFESSPRLASLLMCHNLLETLCNTYSTILESIPAATNGMQHIKKVINDLTFFFATICVRLLSLSGAVYMAQYEDAICFLYLLERRILSKNATKHLSHHVRGTLNTVLKASMAFFQELDLAPSECAFFVRQPKFPMRVLEVLYPFLVVNPPPVPLNSKKIRSRSRLVSTDVTATDALDSAAQERETTPPKLSPKKELSIDRPIRPPGESLELTVKYQQRFVNAEFPVVQSWEIAERLKKVLLVISGHIVSAVRQCDANSGKQLPAEHLTFYESVMITYLKGLKTKFPLDNPLASSGYDVKDDDWHFLHYLTSETVRHELLNIMIVLTSEMVPVSTRVSLVSTIHEHLTAYYIRLILSLSVNLSMSTQIVHNLIACLLTHGEVLLESDRERFETLIDALQDGKATSITAKMLSDNRENQYALARRVQRLERLTEYVANMKEMIEVGPNDLREEGVGKLVDDVQKQKMEMEQLKKEISNLKERMKKQKLEVVKGKTARKLEIKNLLSAAKQPVTNPSEVEERHEEVSNSQSVTDANKPQHYLDEPLVTAANQPANLDANPVAPPIAQFVTESERQPLADLVGPYNEDYQKLRTEFDKLEKEVIKLHEELGKSRKVVDKRLDVITSALQQGKTVSVNHNKKAIGEFEERLQRAKGRLVKRIEDKSKPLAVRAMEVTQRVNENQSAERKKFLEILKVHSSSTIQTQRKWRNLIVNLAHERSVWHEPSLQSRTWVLDPTEGPGRERRRFIRRHNFVDPKFYVKNVDNDDESGKGASENNSQRQKPLGYLFDVSKDFDSAELTKFRLHVNIKIDFCMRCQSVMPGTEVMGEILIGRNVVYFVGDQIDDSSNMQHEEREGVLVSWLGEDIAEIHSRWYSLEDRAIEVFLTNGRTLLLALESTRNRNRLLEAFRLMELPNCREGRSSGGRGFENAILELQSLWMERKITNFQYLMQLNKKAGRTTNDLMQYPVFPFIMADYSSAVLDLANSASYRDLARPIAVQDRSKVARYVQNYVYLKEEKERMSSPHGEANPFLMEPYHYGSHYSNSGTVLHYLVRVSPYTSLFLAFQDGSFDIPDRTFHSLETSYRLSSSDSVTDVKEMLPEFFFLPEMFLNLDGLNFGTRQSGQVVDGVVLPPWCAGDPRLFTLIHRQAMESDVVTASLPAWIDLIFGFKQRGRAAVDAVNVFHPATYYGVNINDLGDAIQRKALLTMIKTYGQTPKQLFKSAHPRADSVDYSRPDNFGSPVGGASASVKSETINAVTSCGGRMYIIAGDDDENDFKKRSAPPTPASDEVDDEAEEPLPSILNFRWGTYVGSPQLASPIITWRQDFDVVGGGAVAVASMTALISEEVFGLSANSCLLAMMGASRSGRSSLEVLFAAVVSWGHPDGVVRIKNQKDKPATNFLYPSHGWAWPHKVTACASVSDCRLFFVGSTSGIITVYSMKFNNDNPSDFELTDPAVNLVGHDQAITCLHVSSEWRVMVSASDDASCIIWDVNRLEYICSFSDHESGIRCLALSRTTGDVATVSWNVPSTATSTSASPKTSSMSQGKKKGSVLWLHSINGRKIAKHEVRDLHVNCLTFSNAPEGLSVNVIAGGLESGAVRLWSSWDLRPLRDICWEHSSPSAVISLIFTPSGLRLFVSREDGHVSLWETPSTHHQRAAKFVPYLKPL